MDDWKKACARLYTEGDLNCRRVVSHSVGRNQLERKYKKIARKRLRKALDKEVQEWYNKDTKNERN